MISGSSNPNFVNVQSASHNYQQHPHVNINTNTGTSSMTPSNYYSRSTAMIPHFNQNQYDTFPIIAGNERTRPNSDHPLRVSDGNLYGQSN